MNDSNNWPLVDPFDDGIRLAGALDACFYCKQKVGEPHRRDCVIVTKLVRFRVTAEVDITVPHCWSDEQIREDVSNRSHDAYNFYDDVMFTLRETERRLDRDPYTLAYIGVVDDTPQRELRDAN